MWIPALAFQAAEESTRVTPFLTLPRKRGREGRGLTRQHFGQQPPIAAHGLPDGEPQLHFPAARRHWMHHRNAKVLLQEIDHRQHPPAGAEEIDCVGAAVLEEAALDMGIDFVGREWPT